MSCNCEQAVLDDARDVVDTVGRDPEYAIPLLQEIQKRHGYLPEDLLEAVACESGIPPADLYGVATFYSQFRFVPQGKYLIRVCKGTACHVAGADILISTLEDDLGISEGGTTEDGLFSLEIVACLGCCSLAPVVMIGEKVYGKLTAAKVKKILKGYRDE
jgi:NADH-quinone oxidoreductase subunit E